MLKENLIIYYLLIFKFYDIINLPGNASKPVPTVHDNIEIIDEFTVPFFI